MNITQSLGQLSFGLLLTVISACNYSNQSDKKDNIFFDEVDLGAFGADTKLFLNARFSECGEWGGHKEIMAIYAKTDKEFYLSYQKYKVDCDSIGAYYGTRNFQKLELEKTLKLNQDNKKSVSDYIQRMVKSKIEERHPGHAGNLFSVVKSDSTLLIQVYDYKEYDVTSYNQLLKELKLPTTSGR